MGLVFRRARIFPAFKASSLFIQQSLFTQSPFINGIFMDTWTTSFN